MSEMSERRNGSARKPAIDLVSDALRQDIFDGKLPAGTPLREVALADRFTVGRYTVRGALAQLAAEGLVDQTPNAGGRVRRFSHSDIADIYEVRRAIEQAAVRLVVRDRRPLGRVRQAADRLEQFEAAEVVRPSLGRKALAADLAFHRSVVDAAGSPRLSRAYATIHAEVRFCITQLATTASQMPGEHRELLELLEVGDTRRANQWIDRHLRESERDLLAALESQRAAG